MEHVKGTFQVDGWRVEPSRRRVVGEAGPVPLEPKVMDVLLCLAATPAEVVPREALLEAVWPDVVVGDEVLTRAISELRKAFGDDHRAPRFIATVPREGYRLIAPVSHAAPDDRVPPAVQAPSRQHRGATAGIVAAGVLIVAMVVAGVVWWMRGEAPTTIPPLREIPVTSRPGAEIDPALSPDGSRIAFVRAEPGTPGRHVVVKVPGTESTLTLTTGAGVDGAPSWSPDGRYVAFVRHDDGGCSLLTVPALGGATRLLSPCSADGVFGLDWSADGRRLFFSERPAHDAPYHVVAYDRTTGRRHVLTDPPATSVGDLFATAAPDGRTLAFVRSAAPGLRDVYRVDVDGGTPVRLTHVHRSINGLAWSADGRSLLFSTYHGSSYNLWQVPASGGAVRWIGTGPGSISSLTTARTTRRLAYVHWQYDTNVWRIPLAGGPQQGDTQARRFIASTQADARPQLAPDGRRVSFVSYRSGLPELWVASADGHDASPVTSLGAYFGGVPRWAPDGRLLVFDVVDAVHGTLDLYITDPDGHATHRLTQTPYSEMAPAWSADGKWIFFGSERSGTWQIWRMPAAGGDPEQVTHHGGLAAQASADGRFLYYVKRDASGLWRQPLPQGDEERLPVPLDHVQDWADWLLADGGVYFVERGAAGRCFLSFFDLATNRRTRLIETARVLQRNAGLARSPDGRWLLFTQEDHAEADVMMVEGIG